MQRYCLALDLIDDEKLIKEYEELHKELWPGIKESIRDAGILVMDIYRTGNRLFMIMEVNESFSFEKKAMADAASELVQRWEQHVWKYQQALPLAKEGEKWILMHQIFALYGLG